MNETNLIKTGMKKIVMTVATQGVILILSLVTGFILPNKMGTSMYGYWQIYVFYLAYLNFFGGGFNDGLTLFYGGYEQKDLPNTKIRSAMRIFYIYLFIISIILFIGVSIFMPTDTKFIFQLLILNIPITCIQCIVLSLFLAVNKTGIYNIVNFILRILCSAFYIGLIFLDVTAYKPMIFVDFLARLIVTVICIFLGRKFLFGKADNLKTGFGELKEKITAGINITISAIAITFIPVAGKAIIQWNESTDVFGTYSFAVSLLHIIIMFTSTAGMVVFPMLKKLDPKKFSVYYDKFIFICNTLVYVALLAYIPSVFVVKHFMPQYVSVLNYIHILLAMCIPLGKIQLIIVPYYKACRLEKSYFLLNVISVAGMLGIAFLVYSVFHNVYSVAFATTIVVVLWGIALERLLIKKIGGKANNKNMMVEIAMLFLFIICASFNIWIFTISYPVCLVVYFALNKEQIMQWVNMFTKRGKNKPEIKKQV